MDLPAALPAESTPAATAPGAVSAEVPRLPFLQLGLQLEGAFVSVHSADVVVIEEVFNMLKKRGVPFATTAQPCLPSSAWGFRLPAPRGATATPAGSSAGPFGASTSGLFGASIFGPSSAPLGGNIITEAGPFGASTSGLFGASIFGPSSAPLGGNIITEVPIPHLPLDVIRKMLLHVDQRQRLVVCARVCRAWREPAIAASTAISYRGSTASRHSSLSTWLSAHGAAVETLDLVCTKLSMSLLPSDPDTMFLPFQQLRNLQHLSAFSLSIAPAAPAAPASPGRAAGGSSSNSTAIGAAAAAHTTSLCALTTLTSLRLEWSMADLTTLEACTNLLCLVLNLALTSAGAGQRGAVVGVALQPLVQLTHLTLGNGMSDAALVHLSGLQRLQELQVLCTDSMTGEGLAGLPVSLTQLQLSSLFPCGNTIHYSSSTTPRLQQLTALQQLVVACYQQFEPALLSGLLQLRHLELQHKSPVGGAGIAALLEVLPQLSQLQHLELDMVVTDHEPAAAAYSAMTASGQLTYLGLPVLPATMEASVAEHVFPAGRQLPQLVCLQSCNTLFSRPGDIECMVGCCSGVQQLHIGRERGLQAGAHVDALGLAALQQLTGLTQLSVFAAEQHEMDATLACALGSHCRGISSLRALKITFMDQAVLDDRVRGLLPLTQLTALTELYIKSHYNHFSPLTFRYKGLPSDVSWLGSAFGGSSSKPVWQQLEGYCKL